MINDKHEVANKCNEYFTNIGPTLANKIPHVNGDHHQFIKTFSGDSMFIMPTDELEIKRITGDLLCTKVLVMMIYHQKFLNRQLIEFLQYCGTFLTNHFFRVGSQ